MNPLLPCRGRGSGCTCPLCLVCGRIWDTCTGPGLTATFRSGVTARLRALQAELLDAAELDRKGSAKGEGPEPPGPPPLGIPVLGGVVYTAREGADCEEEEKKRKRKASSRERSKPRKRRSREGKRGDRSSSVDKAPASSSRKKTERREKSTGSKKDKGKSPSPEAEKRRREKAKAASSCSEGGSKRRQEKAKAASSCSEGGSKRSSRGKAEVKPKQELGPVDTEKGPVAEPIATEAVLAASAKVRPDREEESEEDPRGDLVRRGSRAPRSPSRPPPNRGNWRGPIRSDRYEEPPRWGKNRGKAKFARNHDIRRWGWETFHASKTGSQETRR